PARARALAERVDELLERQSLRPCESHRLGDRLDDAGAHDLIGGLGGLTRAGGAEVRDGAAERLEEGPRELEARGRAAGHDGELRIARALDAAAHRAVEEFDAAGLEERGSLPGGLGADGRAVEHQRTGPEP